MINVIPALAEEARGAAAVHASQYEAWDMIAGTRSPELGGSREYLDIIGVNYYSQNQWVHFRKQLSWNASDPRYRPFQELLLENFQRYQRPLFVAETGIEGDERSSWFRTICEGVQQAQAGGVPIEGVCLYPVMNHPGWDNDRHCPNGLIDYDQQRGSRFLYHPFAKELARQQSLTSGHNQSAVANNQNVKVAEAS